MADDERSEAAAERRKRSTSGATSKAQVSGAAVVQALMTTRTRDATIAAALTVALAAAAPAGAAPNWAPAATATIHPGVQTFTASAQCTANFVLYDASNVYLGQAAHCAGTGSSTDTNGCTSGSLPLGTPVDIGGSQSGTLVYSSWLTMQSHGEKNADTCAYNDLALVKVAAADVGKVNPSIPFWGGPTGIDTDG